MTQYIRKPNEVSAFQFTGQRDLDDAPEWLRDFTVSTGSFMGSNKPIINAVTNLMIPNRHGAMVEILNTDWVVLEHGELKRFRDADFNEIFTISEVEDASQDTQA